MKIDPALEAERFDRAVKRTLQSSGQDVSVREVRRGIRTGEILIDGSTVRPGGRARGGEAIDVSRFVSRAAAVVVPEPELTLRVSRIFEDRDLLVLYKPSGMPMLPVRPSEAGTLLGAAAAYAEEVVAFGPPLEGGAVHRLDVGTSGVSLFAKNREKRAALRKAFSDHRVEKTYLAVCHGPARDKHFCLEGRIFNASSRRVRVLPSTDPRGLPALSRAVVLGVDEVSGLALVRVSTSTGRRHQVRAQLAAFGLPIVCDPVYGKSVSFEFSRLGLHAESVTLSDDQRFIAPPRCTLLDLVNKYFPDFPGVI